MSKLEEQRFDEMTDMICERLLQEGIPEDKHYVFFSAYNLDDNDMPVNNLLQVAYKGSCKVIAPHSDFWDGRGVGIIGIAAEEQGGGEPHGEDFTSDMLLSPTWLDLTVAANNAIIITNDLHHIFFEGFEEVSPGVIELLFGS